MKMRRFDAIRWFLIERAALRLVGFDLLLHSSGCFQLLEGDKMIFECEPFDMMDGFIQGYIKNHPKRDAWGEAYEWASFGCDGANT